MEEQSNRESCNEDSGKTRLEQELRCAHERAELYADNIRVVMEQRDQLGRKLAAVQAAVAAAIRGDYSMSRESIDTPYRGKLLIKGIMDREHERLARDPSNAENIGYNNGLFDLKAAVDKCLQELPPEYLQEKREWKIDDKVMQGWIHNSDVRDRGAF